jgi:GAF domain-containing protein
LQQGTATRTSQANISAALAVATANANANARVPSEQSRTLADMAQRDLDAALQLLADRAQYITGSSGAAIALRRSGRNDMLCRASAGANAPELGALLSTEFGLSGESVRTRQVLRCNDVERDTRVNREACRQLGIASVAVMPVVNDDEVLGVFELFSGKANAFGERDLTALKRLSEMVETAVKLSRAAEQLPESLLETASAPAPVGEAASTGTAVPDDAAPDDEDILEVEAEFLADAVPPQEAGAQGIASVMESVEVQAAAEVLMEKVKPLSASSLAHSEPTAPAHSEPTATTAPKLSPPEPEAKPTARPLLWSIALDAASNGAPAQSEQGQVPATLRNLRKCQACGFPVSPGRTLCVECEEKKWRGQANSRARVSGSVSGAAAAVAPAPRPAPAQSKETSTSAATAAKISQPAKQTEPTKTSPKVQAAVSFRSDPPQSSTKIEAPTREPELVLTAAMSPSRSWVSEHKFVILTLLGIGAGAALLLLR